MARVKFGEVIGMVKLPPPETTQQIPQTLQPDPMELVQKVMDMLPKPKEIEHQDLGYLERAISSQGDRLIEHNERLLAVESKKACSCAPLALPEVKQITHVKDVSAEVLKACEEMGLKLEHDFEKKMLELSNKADKREKRMYCFLSGLLILTLLLHLI